MARQELGIVRAMGGSSDAAGAARSPGGDTILRCVVLGTAGAVVGLLVAGWLLAPLIAPDGVVIVIDPGVVIFAGAGVVIAFAWFVALLVGAAAYGTLLGQRTLAEEAAAARAVGAAAADGENEAAG